MRKTFALAAVVLLIVTGGCSSTTDGTETVEPESAAPEIEQLLDEWNQARARNDADTIDALTTDGATISDHMYMLGESDIRLDLTKAQFLTGVGSFGHEYGLDYYGEPSITGEGPWFATVVEHWSDETSDNLLAGIGVYVVVDEEGAYKVALKHWEGQQLDLDG